MNQYVEIVTQSINTKVKKEVSTNIESFRTYISAMKTLIFLRHGLATLKGPGVDNRARPTVAE